MNTRHLITAAAALALIAGAGAALARGDGPRHGPRTEHFFDRFDTDKDGKVTKAEFDAVHAAKFSAADTNSDQALSEDEFVEAAMAEHRKRVAEHFARMDGNGDGRLTAGEMGKGRHGGDHFAKLDRNSDGVIDKDEIKTGRGGHGKDCGPEGGDD